MKTVRTLTPASLPPLPFQARCTTCDWVSVRTQYAESAEIVAGDHVRATNHTVAIEEDDL